VEGGGVRTFKESFDMKQEISPLMIGGAIVAVIVLAVISFQLFANRQPAGNAYTPSVATGPPPAAPDRATYYRSQGGNSNPYAYSGGTGGSGGGGNPYASGGSR
jgi:hypothetical protein